MDDSDDTARAGEGAQAQQNWARTITYEPASVETPTSLEALRAAVRDAPGQVRPRGSGHSWNHAIATAARSIDTSALTEENGNDVHVEEVRGADGELYVRFSVPAGMVQGDFAELTNRRGAPLPTQGPAPDITLSGFVANGCHGTGWDQPTIAELVYGLELVGPGGELLYFDEQTVPPRLESLGYTAAELMEIVRVNLGALGVISRIVFQLPKDDFNLRLTSQFVPLTEVLDRDDPSKLQRLIEGHDYVELFWFPYNAYRWRGLTPTPLGPEQDELWVMLFDRTTDEVSASAGFIKLWNDLFGLLARAGGAIGPLLDHDERWTPTTSSFALGTMKLKNLVSDSVVLRPADAFLYQKQYFRGFQDLEFTIPMSEQRGFADVVAAFYQLVDRMEAWRREGEGDAKYPVNLNVHARFIGASQAALSPAYAPAGSASHTCYIEYLSYSAGALTQRYLDFNQAFYSEQHGRGWKRWGGIPNWGKYLESVPGIYEYVHARLSARERGESGESQLERFLRVRERVDPGGATFTNDYLEGMFTGRDPGRPPPRRGAPSAEHVALPAIPASRAFAIAGAAALQEAKRLGLEGDGARPDAALELHHDLKASTAYLINEHDELVILQTTHEPVTGRLRYTVASPSQHMDAEATLDRVARFHE